MLIVFLIPLWVQCAVCQLFDCNFQAIRDIVDSQRYDRNALNTYEQLIPQIESSCKGSQWNSLLNQMSYNCGLIFLSVGQDSQAMSSFERVLDSDDRSFQNLSWSRLKELYLKYGFWDKLKGEYVAQRENFVRLENSILDGLHTSNFKSTHRDFEEIFEISPYSLSTRILFHDFLIEQLSQVLDLNIGQSIVDNLQTILEKHTSSIGLETRLQLMYQIAVAQLFVLNSQPQITLRKCLNIDIDYQPCKDLMKIWTAVSKNLPPLAKLTDAEEYLNYDMNWKDLTNFLLEGRNTIIRSHDNSITNFQLLRNFNRECIHKLVNDRPLTHWQKDYSIMDTQSDFILSVQVALCESLDFSGLPRKASAFCSSSMKQMLTSDEQHDLKFYFDNLEGKDKISGIFIAIYETYPHVSIHLLNNIAKILVSMESKEHEFDSYPHWLILYKFIENHRISQSDKLYIKNLCSLITRSFQARHQEHNQRQRASGSRFWNYDFQRSQQQKAWFRGQQQGSAASNEIKADKDYYKILGVEKSAPAKDIRKNYLLLTKKFHPDKQKSLTDEEKHANEEKMSLINEAYEILSNEDKRKQYDVASTDSRGSWNSNHDFGSFNAFSQNAKQRKKRPN